MTLGKHLIRGQSSLEYFMLFGIVMALCLVSVSTFLPRARNGLQGPGKAFETAANRLGVGSGGANIVNSMVVIGDSRNGDPLCPTYLQQCIMGCQSLSNERPGYGIPGMVGEFPSPREMCMAQCVSTWNCM